MFPLLAPFAVSRTPFSAPERPALHCMALLLTAGVEEGPSGQMKKLR